MTPRLGLVVAGAVRVYAAALGVYPRRLRSRYGDEMRRTFAARCRDAAPRGASAILTLLACELADLVAASVAARRQPSALSPQPSAMTSRPQRRSDPVSSLWLDVRYAIRMLRRQPGFTIVAVLTLALGIGANTAVFTVVNGVLLRPLPYHDPDRLVVLLYGRPGRITPWFSPPNYRDFVAETATFQDAAAFTPSTANLTGSGEPERVDGASVSWNYFNVLGVTMREGRGFVEAEGSGDGHVVVISDRLWRRRYGGRSDAIGSTLRLDGRARTIVGITPPEVKLPAGAEFWTPLIFTPADVSPMHGARNGSRSSRG
jgi:putative ABC transport system permease protein